MANGFEREWTSDALCREIGEAPFYYPENTKRKAKLQLDIAAKAICGLCRVREQCLQYSLENNEEYGTWGGYTELERVEMLTQRAS